YVVSNGSHTDFVLPTANAVFDWRVAFPGIGATDHIQIGWGSRTFYAEVPEWKDLTPHVALRALAADRSVILVTPSDEPQAWDPQVRRIRLSPERYRSLVLDIYSRLESTRPLDNAPFFYPGRERFTPFLTCNEWIRRRLAAIHVKTPLWSPFDRAILWHLESEL
ncbi:MAG: DUF2459 domain-containing protein, partial [Zoogloeaceae bacterium]|nr:DUF2459 domain-containing protein [Zoogloeaceae bacterium]